MNGPAASLVLESERITPPMPHAVPARAGAWRIGAAIGSHSVVDFFSFIIIPLMSVLNGRIGMDPAQGAVVLAAGCVSSGSIQPLVAWLSDRFDTRWLGTVAFVIAVCAVGSIGLVHSFHQLIILQVVAAAGIGAYHPVAAAAVGQLSGRRRSAGLAWFYAAGMVGGTVGNIITPAWTRFFGSGDASRGVPAIAWFIAPGLACAAVLGVAIHAIPHRRHGARAEHAALPRRQRRARWRAIWLLYFGNVLRFLTDMCLIQLIIRWSEERAVEAAGLSVGGRAMESLLTPAIRTSAAVMNGNLQAARQIGIGAGGLLLLGLFKGRAERALLIAVPLVGAAIIAATPFAPQRAAIALCVLAGLGYGGVIPTTLSIAQRLLPHRTGLASGLMLGGAWSVAAVGPMIVQRLYSALGLRSSFVIIGTVLAASAVLGWLLPRGLGLGAGSPEETSA